MTLDPIVFLVDDDRELVDSLRFKLSTDGLCCKAYTSAQVFLDEYDSRTPGCLIVDMFMAEMSGLELLKRLNGRGARLPTIVLTAYPEVPSAVTALKGGAIDYIDKNSPTEMLVAAVRQALQRDSERRTTRAELSEICTCMASLTPRERQVMDLIVQGKTSRQISRLLGPTQKTVESHRAHIMEKMRAGGLADLVRKVLITAAGQP